MLNTVLKPYLLPYFSDVFNTFDYNTFNNNIFINADMSQYCSLKIGGSADLLINVTNIDSLKKLTLLANKHSIPYYIIGKGSNIFVLKNGIRGIVLHICFNKITLIDNTSIYAQAGAQLASISNFACKSGLSGFEFAHGIPGSLGGAIFMNAGAYGSEMKDVVECVDVLTLDGSIKQYCRSSLNFSYRNSILQDESLIVLGAKIALSKANAESINKAVCDFDEKRLLKQPLEYPSCGSTFKRPNNAYAAALIEKCNLKGYSIGGACVSEKHSGFIINKNNATCEDFYKLLKYVQKIVLDKTGIELEPEVRIIGDN